MRLEHRRPDRDGRDVLSRLLVGSQLTMSIALDRGHDLDVVGALVGVTSGYLGAAPITGSKRPSEFTLALPEVPFYFALVAVIPRNLTPFQVVLMLCAILPPFAGAQLAARCAARRLQSRGSDTSRRQSQSARALADRRPPHPAERHEPRRRRHHAPHPVDHS